MPAFQDYKKLFEQSPTPMFVYQTNGYRFLAVNESALVQYGYTQAEFLALTALDIRPASEVRAFLNANVTVPGHYRAAGKFLHCNKEGRRFWVQVHTRGTIFMDVDAVLVLAIDIDQQVHAEEQTYNERQNLIAVINNTKDIIWSVNRQHRILSANIAFWKRVSEIVKKPVAELSEADYDLESYAVWIPYFQTAMQGEALTIIREEKQGEQTMFEEVSFNPIYDRNGEVSGVSCFLRDVTAQRDYVKKIEKQNEQLKEIAWMQSHRIRNHVANILGLTSLFNLENAEDNIGLLQNLKSTALQLDEVIKEISALSKDQKEAR